MARSHGEDPRQDLTSHVRISPAAESDLAAAFDWYERAQTGLGEQFLAEVNRSIEFISANPEAYPPVHRKMRRVLLRTFPYALFYIEENDAITVLGCFHGRRSPSAWRRRSRGSGRHN